MISEKGEEGMEMWLGLELQARLTLTRKRNACTRTSAIPLFRSLVARPRLLRTKRTREGKANVR